MHLPRFTIGRLMLAVAFAAVLFAVVSWVRERNRRLSMTLTEKLHEARGTLRPPRRVPTGRVNDGR